jgi:hypothetical protein
MVHFNIVTLFALQALGALAIAVPAGQDEAYAASRESFDVSQVVQVSAEELFAPANFKPYDPARSIPKNESIFEVSDEELAPLDTQLEERGLDKRFPLDNWQDVSVGGCWPIAGSDYTAYFVNFLLLERMLEQNGRAAATVYPNDEWEYNLGNVRLIVRNQNPCITRQLISDEVAVMLRAIWERCENNASGWARYSFEGIQGLPQYISDFIVLILPYGFPVPDYSHTSC